MSIGALACSTSTGPRAMRTETKLELLELEVCARPVVTEAGIMA